MREDWYLRTQAGGWRRHLPKQGIGPPLGWVPEIALGANVGLGRRTYGIEPLRF